jgi:FixJ family two-component response regulator
MSGCDLGKKAARLDSNTPVVYMSGYAESAALDHGGIDRDSQFLQKPFRVAQLAYALRTAIAEDRSSVSRPANPTSGPIKQGSS